RHDARRQHRDGPDLEGPVVRFGRLSEGRHTQHSALHSGRSTVEDAVVSAPRGERSAGHVRVAGLRGGRGGRAVGAGLVAAVTGAIVATVVPAVVATVVATVTAAVVRRGLLLLGGLGAGRRRDVD